MSDLPRVVSSEVVYEGSLFDIAVDRLVMDGRIEAVREVVRHPGAVCMVPVDADGRLLLVRQYRHPAGKRLLELPAGTLEPGEEPLATAIRELQEEVGRHPGSIEPMGGFWVAPGYTTEYIHLFVCTDLSRSELAGDEDEDIEVEVVTVSDALAFIEAGEICDAKSVIGILRWLRSRE